MNERLTRETLCGCHYAHGARWPTGHMDQGTPMLYLSLSPPRLRPTGHHLSGQPAKIHPSNFNRFIGRFAASLLSICDGCRQAQRGGGGGGSGRRPAILRGAFGMSPFEPPLAHTIADTASHHPNVAAVGFSLHTRCEQRVDRRGSPSFCCCNCAVGFSGCPFTRRLETTADVRADASQMVIGDRILIRHEEQSNTTNSGLIMQDGGANDDFVVGEVRVCITCVGPRGPWR